MPVPANLGRGHTFLFKLKIFLTFSYIFYCPRQNPPLKLSFVFCLRSDDKSLENRLENKPQKVQLFSQSATLSLANCPTGRLSGLEYYYVTL